MADIIKPENDDLLYRHIKLDNGIEVRASVSDRAPVFRL